MTSSPIRLVARAIALITALTIVGTARAEAQDSAYWEAYKKQVEAVKRDTIPQNAYQGWKQYELNCSRCHGEYGVGTSFAPALIVSLKDGGTVPDQTAFITVVCQGRTDKGMPGWCALGLEMDKIQNIYAYLKLRADGKVAAGRPA
ncbi:MAG: c-type cytochrome, methanol metabolism-related, partial [Gemmatimonadetes bacterium]|nr:c-type cytochrome, methanol metabolism-related [Gemmatimonadota bacterium]